MSGTVVLVVGAITFVLGWRLVVGSRAATETKAGDLAKSEFDYLVWFYFGVPMILAILILIVAIANR